MAQLQLIQQKIFDVRGLKVMLDFDLADLYEVDTKVLNQAVKRNLTRFPEDFMFRLIEKEWHDMRSQFVTSYSEPLDNQKASLSNTENSQKKRRSDLLPYAFTEHGVTMLASVLKSGRAVQMNIAIVRAFISLRKMALQYADVLDKIGEISERVNNHDVRLDKIYEAIENLLKQKEAQEEWMENRKRIGFKQQL